MTNRMQFGVISVQAICKRPAGLCNLFASVLQASAIKTAKLLWHKEKKAAYKDPSRVLIESLKVLYRTLQGSFKHKR